MCNYGPPYACPSGCWPAGHQCHIYIYIVCVCVCVSVSRSYASLLLSYIHLCVHIYIYIFVFCSKVFRVPKVTCVCLLLQGQVLHRLRAEPLLHRGALTGHDCLPSICNPFLALPLLPPNGMPHCNISKCPCQSSSRLAKPFCSVGGIAWHERHEQRQ